MYHRTFRSSKSVYYSACCAKHATCYVFAETTHSVTAPPSIEFVVFAQSRLFRVSSKSIYGFWSHARSKIVLFRWFRCWLIQQLRLSSRDDKRYLSFCLMIKLIVYVDQYATCIYSRQVANQRWLGTPFFRCRKLRDPIRRKKNENVNISLFDGDQYVALLFFAGTALDLYQTLALFISCNLHQSGRTKIPGV